MKRGDQVRERLQAYLLGTERLPDFHAWFVGWRRVNPDSGDALTHDVALRLAEFTRGDWSEPQLRGLLLALLEGPTLAPNTLCINCLIRYEKLIELPLEWKRSIFRMLYFLSVYVLTKINGYIDLN